MCAGDASHSGILHIKLNAEIDVVAVVAVVFVVNGKSFRFETGMRRHIRPVFNLGIRKYIIVGIAACLAKFLPVHWRIVLT